MYLKGANKTFLSKLLQPSRRNFGSVQAFKQAFEATAAAEQAKEINPVFSGYEYQTLGA